MARNNIPVADEFDEQDEAVEVESAVVVGTPTKTGRVKGTWTMYWGLESYDFEDGKRYQLPVELYDYLRAAGNIYDTL